MFDSDLPYKNDPGGGPGMLSSGDLMTIWRKYFHKAQDTVHIAAAWANRRNIIVAGSAVLQDVVRRFRREWRQAAAL